MRLFVLGNGSRRGVTEEAERLLPFLHGHCDVVLVDLVQQVDLGKHEADLALVLGGDGSILRAARQMGYRQIPVLGINLGKLGFLADLSPEQLRTCLPRVLCGEYTVTRHLMYECQVTGPGGPRTILGLNEVVVRAGPPFHLVDVDLAIDGTPIATFSGDGVILSTPVGSTAQSLSAGGPILSQDLCAFVITPVCPHALTYRPLVERADRVYTFRVRPSLPEVALIADGQEPLAISREHEITIRQAQVAFQLVKVHGHSYYQTLRDKLHWGALPSYRREP